MVSPEIIIFSDCFSIAIRENRRLFFLDTFPRGPRASLIFSPTTPRPYLTPKDVYKSSRGRSEAVDRLTPGGGHSAVRAVVPGRRAPTRMIASRICFADIRLSSGLKAAVASSPDLMHIDGCQSAFTVCLPGVTSPCPS